MGEYAVAKTSVWWDIENCCVPRSCDPQLIVQNMSSALAAAGYRGPISVSAYGDTHQIPHNVQHALSSTGVSLNHVPAGIKDASDKKILVDMLFWAIDNPPPANYLLISGDRDFSNAIHKLKMRRYNILLAQPQSVSQTLTAAANNVWLWRSLVAGEPPLAESPYISSTSSGNKDDLDTSKNIISSSSDMTQDTNSAVQNILCDHQSGANSNADKKYEVKHPREVQTGKSKPTRRLPKKRSNPGGSGFTKQTVSKKSKGGIDSTEQSKFKQPRIGQVKAVPGQPLICYRCGEGHRAADCTFDGDCCRCGKPGHKDRVCKENPDSIVKWMPAHAQDLATSSPGSVHVMNSASQLHPTCSSPLECSQQVSPGVPSPSPVPPMAPAPPKMGGGPSSVPAHSGVCAKPTAVQVGRGGMAQQTTSVPHPPMAVPAYRPSQGQGMLCFKCGVVGHCAAQCTYIGSCRRCHQAGHMERVCKENPDSIIKWEQLHAYALAMSSQGSVHMTAPASQLHQTWTPPLGCFLQANPAVPAPSPTPATPAPPHRGVTDSSTPARPGVSATPTAVSLGKPDVVPQPTSSALRPPTAGLAYRPVLGQHHQVGSSQLLPAWTQHPGYFWQAAPVVPSPLPAPPVTPMLPQPGVAASPRPAHYGAYPMPFPFPFGRPW
ncbi:uncharacterized protein LOC124678533 [Lolium rigidum]|uniref:uncharacterized protein LOC124678533 n=1 Tax=Lolium rigidum TaxID=89674 RepID=UPI001F5DEF25|nr:uncharacterized protein LOC124678533 [Lolium rigidum]XP_047070362.1 uncharacterized protein LOC124678533 [Lolium rigidum]XP_047070363.1 uncharacterized protein LOC124678533 [Lolium rigidum]